MSEDTNKASQSEEEKQVEERQEDPSEIYAEMDRAAEEVQAVEEKKEEEPEKEEEKQEEEKPEEEENVPRGTSEEEPESNAERSKLGRKVKGIEEGLAKTQDTLAQILDTLKGQKEPVREEPKTDIELDEDFLIPTTKQEFIEQVASIIHNEKIRNEFDKLSESQAKAQSEKRLSYETKYVETISNFDEDPYFEEVKQVMLDDAPDNPYNRLYNLNTPSEDAEKNFLAAKAHVLEMKLKGTDKNINLRQDKRKPNNPDVKTNNTTHEKKEIKLDAAAADFVKNLENRGENTEELVKRAFA